MNYANFGSEIGENMGGRGRTGSCRRGGRKIVQDIEKLLAQGQTVQLSPRGYSMYPLFLPGRDQAVIAPLTRPPRRGDVVLYRREGSILVLHRVWRVRRGKFYAVGDHQQEVEGPLEMKCLRGVLVGVVRKGHEFRTSNPIYRLLTWIWLYLRPVRIPMMAAAARIKRAVR